MAYTINGDTIQGGAGDDEILVARRWADVTGGDGNDTIFVDYGFRAHNSVTVHEGPGDDRIIGADTVIYPGAFRDYVIDPNAYTY